MMLSSTPVTPTSHSETAPMSQTLEVEKEFWGEGIEGIDPIMREQMSQVSISNLQWNPSYCFSRPLS